MTNGAEGEAKATLRYPSIALLQDLRSLLFLPFSCLPAPALNQNGHRKSRRPPACSLRHRAQRNGPTSHLSFCRLEG